MGARYMVGVDWLVALYYMHYKSEDLLPHQTSAMSTAS